MCQMLHHSECLKSLSPEEEKVEISLDKIGFCKTTELLEVKLDGRECIVTYFLCTVTHCQIPLRSTTSVSTLTNYILELYKNHILNYTRCN